MAAECALNLAPLWLDELRQENHFCTLFLYFICITVFTLIKEIKNSVQELLHVQHICHDQVVIVQWQVSNNGGGGELGAPSGWHLRQTILTFFTFTTVHSATYHYSVPCNAYSQNSKLYQNSENFPDPHLNALLSRNINQLVHLDIII